MKYIHNFWRVLEVRKRVIESGRSAFCIVHADPDCHCSKRVSYTEMLSILGYFADINIQQGKDSGIVVNIPSDRDYIYPKFPLSGGNKATPCGEVYIDPEARIVGQIYATRTNDYVRLLVNPRLMGEPVVVEGNYLPIEGITWGQVYSGVFKPIISYEFPKWTVYPADKPNYTLYSDGLGVFIR